MTAMTIETTSGPGAGPAEAAFSESGAASTDAILPAARPAGAAAWRAVAASALVARSRSALAAGAAAAALALAASSSSPAVAATLGDDGLHKAEWMRDTFKDLREDLDEARGEGRRLMVIVEQRGCIYCTRMHEDVFPQPEISSLLNDRYFVVQVNMFGDVEVTDFDGETLSEKEMVRKWGLLFTPTLMFFPDEVPEGVPAQNAAVATMPGAFGKWTTLNLLTWILEEGYDGDEDFQKYHARKFESQGG